VLHILQWSEKRYHSLSVQNKVYVKMNNEIILQNMDSNHVSGTNTFY